MLDVRVCSSCLSKRSDGYSRVSEKIWDSCLDYLLQQEHCVIDPDDGVMLVYSDKAKQHLLMSNEDGFNVKDELLKEVIKAGFTSFRMEPSKD